MKDASSKAYFFPPNGGTTRSARWPEAAATCQDQAAAPAPNLTPRQLEVLALLCEGLPNKLICRRLNIATGTVKVHIGCILRELGVTSRLQAVVVARTCGLVDAMAASGVRKGDLSADCSAH